MKKLITLLCVLGAVSAVASERFAATVRSRITNGAGSNTYNVWTNDNTRAAYVRSFSLVRTNGAFGEGTLKVATGGITNYLVIVNASDTNISPVTLFYLLPGDVVQVFESDVTSHDIDATINLEEKR